jgi:threonine aldolase
VIRYEFASDNTAGATPEAMDALVAANCGFGAGYGQDRLTRKAADLVRELLDADADVYFVSTGTAANGLSLSAICRSFDSVLAHQHAHIITDETGAPGLFGHGLQLIGLPGPNGKLDVGLLGRTLQTKRGAHCQVPGALSLSNATEYGSVYSVAAIAELTQIAKAASIATYLDGSRLANAAAAGFDLRAIKKLSIDLLLMGGTKAGMPPTEALVILDRKLAARFDARLKQAGQLPSKGRFLAAPWIGMLEHGTWVARAAHANAMARKLAAAIPFELAHPVEANSVFVHMADPDHRRVLEQGWAVFRMADDSVRFMCSWATTDQLIEEFVAALCLVRRTSGSGC